MNECATAGYDGTVCRVLRLLYR